MRREESNRRANGDNVVGKWFQQKELDRISAVEAKSSARQGGKINPAPHGTGCQFGSIGPLSLREMVVNTGPLSPRERLG